MNYKIFEVHIVYQGTQISEIAVLWESNESHKWVRASYCTSEPCCGYKFIMPNEIPSPDLFQKVAGRGSNLPDNLKKKYFPGKRNWEE
jgi:hypothetical protein